MVLGLFGCIWCAGMGRFLRLLAMQIQIYTGRLIAAGCTSMFIIQAFVNIGGVLGLCSFRVSPSVYLGNGGSTIMSSILMVGL